MNGLLYRLFEVFAKWKLNYPKIIIFLYFTHDAVKDFSTAFIYHPNHNLCNMVIYKEHFIILMLAVKLKKQSENKKLNFVLVFNICKLEIKLAPYVLIKHFTPYKKNINVIKPRFLILNTVINYFVGC